MLNIVQKDITTVTQGIICHQVNCRGVMGAGLALQIRNKFPEVYDEYIKAFKLGKLNLGAVVIVQITNSLWVANLCGQYRYGSTGKFTNYPSVRQCLCSVKQFKETQQKLISTPLLVYIPYNMGCGLAGGDWSIMSLLIENNIPDAIIAKH